MMEQKVFEDLGEQALLMEAEEQIRERKYQKAPGILRGLAEKYPENGRIAFDLGNIALLENDYSLACRYYESALDKHYECWSVYQNMAAAKEKTGEIKAAERLFNQAADSAMEPETKWLALSALALFYIHNRMLLKAEKTAAQMTEMYPDNYQGHHLHFLVLLERKRYSDVEGYFEDAREVFGHFPQYLADRMVYLEIMGRQEDILKLIEEEPVVMEVFPELALRKKAQILLGRGDRKAVKEVIEVLFRDYGDMDAAFSSMVIDMMEGRWVRAGKIANMILDQEKETLGPRFYMAMYLQIYIFYMAYEGKPPEEVRMLMEKEAALYINWLEENGMDTGGVREGLKAVICPDDKTSASI